jgi:hypothetical protein
MIYFSRPTEMYRKVLRDRRRYSEKNRLIPSYIRSRFIQIEFRLYIIHCVQSNQYIIKSTSSNMTKEGKKNKQSCLCIIGCVCLAKIDQTAKEMAKFSLELNYAQEGRAPK